MNNKEYLERLFDSDKSLIIYRVKDGFDIFTDFFKRFNLTTKNAKLFFSQTIKKRNSKNKFFDGYVGFLSYELLCKLINVKIPKQNSNGFHKNIFYKPNPDIQLKRRIQFHLLGGI